jgi:UV DNA damage endonuclease
VYRFRLGYASLNTQLQSPARRVRLVNATSERLRELLAANLDALEAVLRWNAEQDIRVFRLSSNIVPLASHPVNRLRWWDELADRFAALGNLMKEEGMKLSTHPGQYTVLGSPNPAVTSAGIAELDYHGRMLTAFGLDATHKIVLHAGGAYGEPDAALARFAASYARISPAARERLVLENDERWSLAEVLAFAGRLGTPVVFDAFHHTLRPSLPHLGLREAVLAAAQTWGPADGRQEIHFSTQAAGRRPGAHSDSLDLEEFSAFAAEVGDLPLDCILEVKDKERSVLRARAMLRAAVAPERDGALG